jgi:hypothetical protein
MVMMSCIGHNIICIHVFSLDDKDKNNVFHGPL